MDQVTSNEEKKVRCVQFNDRVYTVGGLRTKNGFEWRPFSSQQKSEHRHSSSDVTSRDSQQLQAGLHEHVETARQNITNSLQQLTAADGGSVTGCSRGVSTAVTDLTTVNGWSQSSGQATTAWMCPANVQLSKAPCEAASVVQQMISRYQVTSQQQSDDKLVFEDGLTHLRNLYESQLASSRSDTTIHTVYYAALLL